MEAPLIRTRSAAQCSPLAVWVHHCNYHDESSGVLRLRSRIARLDESRETGAPLSSHHVSELVVSQGETCALRPRARAANLAENNVDATPDPP
jgi:hypothetical protein